MPRLTNTSLHSLAECVPDPGVFPDLTLKLNAGQVDNGDHDLTLVCSDGLVTTNQCVMAAASSFVRKILADCHLVEAGRTGRKEDMVTIHLPELDYSSVIRVVTCFTEGVVRLPLSGGWGDHSVKKKLEAAWRVLGIDRVDLEDIFNNTSVSVQNEIIEIEEENIVDIKKEDVPDRLQTLCDTGIASVGGEKKRKGEDVDNEWSPSLEEENKSKEEDGSDEDWKPRRSHRKKKKKSYDLETVAPASVNVHNESVILKPEPSATVNVLDEYIVKPEPTTSVIVNVLDESATEKSNERGPGRVRPKRSIASMNDMTSATRPKLRTRSSLFDASPSSPTPAISAPIIIKKNQTLVQPQPTVIQPKLTVIQPQPPAKTQPIKSQPNVAQPQPSVPLSKSELAEKKAKIDRTSFALEPSNCFVCNKAEDKDGRPLNMKNLFYLRNHYAKCLYNEGKVFKAVSAGAENTDPDGRPKDEFGMKNGKMYKCNVAGCWLQQKKGTHSQVCYKVYAIHMVSQHGVMEKLLEEDNRPEPQSLLQKIRAYERCEVIEQQPKKAVVVINDEHSKKAVVVNNYEQPKKAVVVNNYEQPKKAVVVYNYQQPKKAAVMINVKVEEDEKKNEVVEKVLEKSKVFEATASAWDAALVQELIVAENDDDPDNPAELSEIVELPEIERKFVVKTFDRTEDINVFRKVNTIKSKPEKVLNIFKPVEKVESILSEPLLVNKKLDEPIPDLDEKYKLTNERFHTCFLCNGMGTNSKDSHHLSFKNLIKLKEHYARCIYTEGNMYKFVSPGKDNMDDHGKPIDEYGKTNGKMYKCKIQGCWLQRKLGLRGHVCYKVYSIHMAGQHGVLETILEQDSRPYMKEILRGIRKELGGNASLARCRFEECQEIQFKLEVNKRELKMHYATQHFRKWFEGRDKRGLDRMPTMEFSVKGGTRATCDRCTKESKKPIYIQGDNEAIMGHLVVKHDLLVDALREAGDSIKEAKDVVKDLYPDQVTEFYMATLSSKQGAIPLNEDFMDKMFI